VNLRATRAAALAGVAILALARAAGAQISPGPLSRAHARLEGSTRCLDCHDPREGVAASKCLACHEPLAKRVAAGKGLHARPDYRECHRCHVEHQGAEFELVHWGKQGVAAFDHALTGHALQGKHAKLECASCHKTRSFLGQPAECASCHKDEHRGQFQGRACGACHGEQAWKPAPGFDHAKTGWPLAGRHAAVACDRCHAARRADAQGGAQSFRVFRVAGGRGCASCHEDVHKGRFGSACASCHSAAGWRQTKVAASFDHGRTGYPLAGRHARVACDGCHEPGRPMRLPHGSCADCHEDVHAVTPARRADAGRCETCHTVEEFRPARFGPDDHAKTAYPLRGAHLAVACDECHRRAAGAASVRRASLAASVPARVPLKLAAERCADCHRDPHRGEAAVVSAAAGCETCHRVEAWREVGFDHATTRYPLTGQHARVACARCHARAEGAAAPAPIAFKGSSTACAECHRDPHAGQFAAAAGRTDCERCHATDSLRASRFRHDRDARYPLDGAHARLACAACHRADARAGEQVVRYKPLPVACAGCHGAGKTAAMGGPR
jgi:hypothetical protein